MRGYVRLDKYGKLNMLFLSVIAAVLLTAFGFCDNIKAQDMPFSFKPGEKLTFELKWTIIPAGEAVLEVLPIETVNGIQSYHFVMTVRTNSFVDQFYKVRDRIDAYTDSQMTRSILYKKKQHEGTSRRDIVVEFNREKNQAQYSDFNNKLEPIDLYSRSV